MSLHDNIKLPGDAYEGLLSEDVIETTGETNDSIENLSDMQTAHSNSVHTLREFDRAKSLAYFCGDGKVLQKVLAAVLCSYNLAHQSMVG